MAGLTKAEEEMLIASVKSRKRDGATVVATINDETEPEPQPQEPPPKPTTTQKRKKRGGSFDEMFLHRNETKLRQCAYVDKELYFKVAKIVNVVTDKRVTIGAYLDSIIEQHLEEHKDEINEKLINNIKI
ncbi:MAG: DUF3408 domain-containing protein [Rikenellaceae bacterium]